MINCEHCGLEIFLKKINRYWIKFEDQGCTTIHMPHKPQTTITNKDHVLLTQTITRISQLEKKVTELEKKNNGTDNEI